jgi:hypothetical protein
LCSSAAQGIQNGSIDLVDLGLATLGGAFSDASQQAALEGDQINSVLLKGLSLAVADGLIARCIDKVNQSCR